MEALDLQGLPSGGDSWTRTNGLTSLRSFGRVRNRRTAALEWRLYLLLTTLPPRFIPHCGRFGSAPHDVNDVHWATGQAVKLKCGREHT